MHALWLITATWAAGAAVEPPSPGYAPAPAAPMVRVITSNGSQLVPANPADPRASPYHGIAQASPVPPAPAPAGRVAATFARPAPLTPVAARPLATPQAGTGIVPVRVLEVKASLLFSEDPRAKAGHEHDYSWITGYLYYVHANGGRWVVRYAALDEVDRHGGSVVLAPGLEMGNYREGDLVTVHGTVMNEGRPVRSFGGALYRVDGIEMVERK